MFLAQLLLSSISSFVYRIDTLSDLGLGAAKTTHPCNISGRLRPLVCRRRNFCKEYPSYAGIRVGGAMALQTTPLLVWTMRAENAISEIMELATSLPFAVREEVAMPPPFIHSRISSFRRAFPYSFVSPSFLQAIVVKIGGTQKK